MSNTKRNPTPSQIAFSKRNEESSYFLIDGVPHHKVGTFNNKNGSCSHNIKNLVTGTFKMMGGVEVDRLINKNRTQ